MSLELVLFDYLNDIKRNNRNTIINLGGTSGGGGGTSGQTTWIGQLVQTRVSYDETEAETSSTSSTPSLVDNLNHIRQRISVVEDSLGISNNYARELTLYPSVSQLLRIDVTTIPSGDGGYAGRVSDAFSFSTPPGDYIHNLFNGAYESGEEGLSASYVSEELGIATIASGVWTLSLSYEAGLLVSDPSVHLDPIPSGVVYLYPRLYTYKDETEGYPFGLKTLIHEYTTVSGITDGEHHTELLEVTLSGLSLDYDDRLLLIINSNLTETGFGLLNAYLSYYVSNLYAINAPTYLSTPIAYPSNIIDVSSISVLKIYEDYVAIASGVNALNFNSSQVNLTVSDNMVTVATIPGEGIDIRSTAIPSGYLLSSNGNGGANWVENDFTSGSGSGDMLKSVYDTDNNGIVDNSSQLEGHPTGYFALSSHVHTETSSLIHITAPISLPPTYTQLVTAIGDPTILGTKNYLLSDFNTDKLYYVVSDGNSFFYTPMTLPYQEEGEEIPASGTGDIVTLMGGGAWCWFADPRAFYYNGKAYFGAICDNRQIYVRAWDYATESVTTGDDLRTMTTLDDHDNPALLLRYSDKKIMAFYTHHTSLNLYMRISTSPENTETWDTEIDLDSQIGGAYYTYPSPIQLIGEVNTPIYLFFREHTPSVADYPQWCYSKSTDNGSTWSTKTAFFKTVGNYSVYLKECPNGINRIDFALSHCHPAEGNSSIYHFYYEDGNYYKTDGTLITSSLPLDKSDVTLVYDGSTISSWVWDIAVDSDGIPYITYVTFPTTSDHRYNYARWTGTSWETHEVCQGGPYFPSSGSLGQEYYSGGIVLDQVNPTNVYLSKKVGSYFEIYKYSTSDGGTTWDDLALTTNSNVGIGCARPVCVRNYPGSGIRVMWFKGSYTTYLNFSTNLYGTDL